MERIFKFFNTVFQLENTFYGIFVLQRIFKSCFGLFSLIFVGFKFLQTWCGVLKKAFGLNRVCKKIQYNFHKYLREIFIFFKISIIFQFSYTFF